MEYNFIECCNSAAMVIAQKFSNGIGGIGVENTFPAIVFQTLEIFYSISLNAFGYLPDELPVAPGRSDGGECGVSRADNFGYGLRNIPIYSIEYFAGVVMAVDCRRRMQPAGGNVEWRIRAECVI